MAFIKNQLILDDPQYNRKIYLGVAYDCNSLIGVLPPGLFANNNIEQEEYMTLASMPNYINDHTDYLKAYVKAYLKISKCIKKMKLI